MQEDRTIKDLFFELLRVAIGNQGGVSKTPTEEEWRNVYRLCTKHAVVGICFYAIKLLKAQQQMPSNQLYYEWMGVALQTQLRSEQMDKRCEDLCNLFKDAGFESCILKGQGLARLYPKDVLRLRQSGDIDIWTKASHDDILGYARKNNYQINTVDYRDTDIRFFDDTVVEVHFKPSILYNPTTNRRLQKYYSGIQDECCAHNVEGVNFASPTITFNLVQAMIHVCGHFLSEGVGLRQLMDYYFILQRSTERERKDAFVFLKSVNKGMMVSGIMYVLNTVFKLKDEYMLCRPNVSIGEFLLNEIMTSGNFGHYDTRYEHISKNRRWAHAVMVLKREIRFLKYMPDEVICAPFWKLWHYCWRKWKGYL